MNGPKNTSFADRLSVAANAKKAQLERAARARSAAESPTAVGRRSARDAVRAARDARMAERKATKLAIEASRLLPWPRHKLPRLALVRLP
jgi:hypothetical protein